MVRTVWRSHGMLCTVNGDSNNELCHLTLSQNGMRKLNFNPQWLPHLHTTELLIKVLTYLNSSGYSKLLKIKFKKYK